MSDQIVLSMWSAPTNWEKGMNRIVGGIRYVRKIAMPIERLPGKRRRARP